MDKKLSHINDPCFLLLNKMSKDERYLLKIKDVVKKEWIDTPPTNTTQKLFSYLIEYYNHFKELPNKETLIEDIKEYDSEIDIDKIEEILSHDYENEESIRLTEQFIRESNYQDILKETIESGDYSKLSKIKNIDSFSLDDSNGFNMLDLDRIEEMIDSNNEETTVPTGDSLLDGVIGGWRNKALYTIMGASGFGKSLFLQNFAVDSINRGYNVVIYTLEMSEVAYAQRLFSIMTKIPIKELFLNKERAFNKFHLTYGKTLNPGNFIVKEFPTKTATINNIKGHLKDLSFKPDLIIVDYAELLKPTSKYNNKWEELAGIFGEIRGMAIEYDVPVLTGAQTNRQALTDEGSTKEFISQTHTGGSLGLIQITDVALTIIQSNVQKEEGSISLNVLKNRYGQTNKLLTYPIEYDKTKIDFNSSDRIKEDTSTPLKEPEKKNNVEKYRNKLSQQGYSLDELEKTLRGKK